MRVVLVAVAVLGLASVAGCDPLSGHHPFGACPTSAGMKDASQHTKPSSFAPHPRSATRSYGQPIGDKILTRHVKKKPAAAPPEA
jgi:hypothetical protein